MPARLCLPLDTSHPPLPLTFPKTDKFPAGPAPAGPTSKAEASFLQGALLALLGWPSRLPAAAAASQAKPSWRPWLGPAGWPGLHKELRSLGRGGVHSHCAACSRGHRRCTQGPRWRSGAIRWWLSSGNLHNRYPLFWQPTRRGG